MRKIVRSMLITTVLLSACGGSVSTVSSSTESTGSTESTETTATTISTMSLSSASENGGCSGYTQSSDVAPFTTEWGTCMFEGTEVQAYVFPNQTAVDEFFKTVSGFGVIAEQTAIATQSNGQVFVWAPDDATKLTALKTVFAG